MWKCLICGADTELRVQERPICLDCDAKDAELRPVETPADTVLPVSSRAVPESRKG